MTTYNTITARRTVRKFKQMPISAEQLASYVNAARLAPSAANLQPLRYVAVHTPEMCEKLFPLLKWAGYLNGAYTPAESERPTAYVAVCADTSVRNTYWEVDAGAAIENLILAALEDGVGACWMGAIDRPAIRELLALPEHLELRYVVALGYPAEQPQEVAFDGDVKYYLDGDTLCVPKRTLEDVLTVL